MKTPFNNKSPIRVDGPPNMLLLLDSGRCPHCFNPLITAPSVHNPGGEAQVCPECDYEYDTEANVEDDREITTPIEDEILRSS